MNTREQLEKELKEALEVVEAIQKKIGDFAARPENNHFDNLDTASSVIEDALYNEAHEACEGSHRCGEDFYTRQFLVNGILYEGRLDVEYNRHDKTYYYVDVTNFSVKQLSGSTDTDDQPQS